MMNPIKQRFYTERYEKEKKFLQLQEEFVAIPRTSPMTAKFYARHEQISASEVRPEYVDLVKKRFVLGPKDIYSYKPPAVNMEYGWFAHSPVSRATDSRLRFPRTRTDFVANELQIRHAHKGLPVEKFTGIPFKITCPGVWLCPNGIVALRITSLGCTLESDRVSPIFPLLFHNEYNFKKTFTRLAALTELQRRLETELFYAELIQWVAPCTRPPVVLATFESTLADVLYPVPQYKGLLAGVDVDLLMDPTKYFPGIIAPKIEISTKTVIEEVLGLCNLNPGETCVVNPKTINSKHLPCVPRKRPTKGIIRQRRVCHSRGKSHNQNYQPARCLGGPSNAESVYQSRQNQCNDCYHPADEKSYCFGDTNAKRKNQCSSSVCANLRVFSNCPVCSRYACQFSGKCGEPCNDRSVHSRHKQDQKRVDNLCCTRCSCTCKLDSCAALNEPMYTSRSRDQCDKEIRRALRCTEQNYGGRDISECDTIYEHDKNDSRQCFYKNLERFYKRMYKHAKLRALEAS